MANKYGCDLTDGNAEMFEADPMKVYELEMQRDNAAGLLKDALETIKILKESAVRREKKIKSAFREVDNQRAKFKESEEKLKDTRTLLDGTGRALAWALNYVEKPEEGTVTYEAWLKADDARKSVIEFFFGDRP
jgi:hypothetical protein